MLSIDHNNDKPTLFFYKDNVFENKELKFLENLEYVDGIHNNRPVSRKQLWFQENNKYFCPVWNKRLTRWESNEYNDTLKIIQDKVQEYVYNLDNEMNFFKENNINIPKFNSCLINYYESGSDFIPPHKDTPISFGEYPTIACVSYGETREMVLKNKYECYKFELKSNSLFIMAGSSQKYYTHEILKSDNQSSRYSMTFREYIL
jgi:alkylated DNA repair dioxygenase AlkB